MTDYQKWLERVDNLLQVQRDRCLDLISANFTRRELIELKMMIEVLMEKALEQEPKWIPVSERLPEDLEPVNITWVNHNPESYYADIKDKPFTATGYYCNGRWWWYSVTCQDYLYEYGRCDVDAMDDDIEVIAWMPLPEPYKGESEDKDKGGGRFVIDKKFPNSTHGILTNYLSEKDIKTVIARQYRTTNEQVELMTKPEISAVVRTIVKYEEDK